MKMDRGSTRISYPHSLLCFIHPLLLEGTYEGGSGRSSEGSICCTAILQPMHHFAYGPSLARGRRVKWCAHVLISMRICTHVCVWCVS